MLAKCLNRYQQVIQNDQYPGVDCFHSCQLEEEQSSIGKQESCSTKTESNVSNLELLTGIIIANNQSTSNDSTSLTNAKSTVEELTELFGNNNAITTNAKDIDTMDAKSLEKCDLLHSDGGEASSLESLKSNENLHGNVMKNVKDTNNQNVKEKQSVATGSPSSRKSSSNDLKPIDELSEELFQHNLLPSEIRQHTFKRYNPRRINCQ